MQLAPGPGCPDLLHGVLEGDEGSLCRCGFNRVFWSRPIELGCERVGQSLAPAAYAAQRAAALWIARESTDQVTRTPPRPR